jgi:PKD repeat protein
MKKFFTLFFSALMVLFLTTGVVKADEMTINGQVVMGPQGMPAPGVPVMVFLASDSVMVDAVTDEGGFFEAEIEAEDGYQGDVVVQVFDWCTMISLEEVFPFVNGDVITTLFHVCVEGGGGGGGGNDCHANFQWMPLEGLQISFWDESWGNDIEEWTWEFGDGTTGTGIEIVHLYTEPGMYQVTLTIAGDECSDSRTKMVHVMDSIPPQPDCQAMFGYEPEEGLTVQFIDLSWGEDIDDYLWDFGDGNISNEQEPEHTYAEQGMYLVSLTISGDECASSIEMPVHVMDSIWPPQGCHANFHWEMMDDLMVQFFNASQGEEIDEYVWDFGDGTFSDEMDPIHIYAEEGMYQVSLTIFGDDCQDIKVKNVNVNGNQPPQGCHAMFFYEYTEDPLTINFIDLSMGEITAWNWSFGDEMTSSEQNPTHTYAEEGMYMVSLEITCDSCTNAIEMPVFVGDSVWPPQPGCHANFHWENMDDLLVQFINSSQGEEIEEYLWDFGDGTTSDEFEPLHAFAEEGVYEVTLTVSGAECLDTKTKVVHVGNNWPPNNNCHANYDWAVHEDGVTVTFTDTSVGDSIQEWMWDFGDGEISLEQNPVHVFPEEGLYFVTLTITSGDCMDAKTRHIHVGNGGMPPQNCHAMFFPEYISDMTIAFLDMSMGDIESWFWDFGDGNTSTEQEPVHTYAEAGFYLVSLTVEGEECADSLAMEIMVDEPWNNNPCEALFLPEFTNNLEVTFYDMSIGNVESWSWNFGDGTASYEQNPVHTYEQVGTYLVTLSIQTDDGCSHVYSVELYLESMSYSAMHSSTGVTGLEEQTNVTAVNVYPNPVGNMMNITFTAQSDLDVDFIVTNTMGQQVLNGTYSVNAASNHLQVNTANLEKGIYIMQLRSADGSVATHKFIK